MITNIAITLVTPFTVTDAPAPVAEQPTIPAVSYNWDTQTVQASDEDSLDFGATGTFSFIPGGHGQMCVDDWHLA